MQFNFKTAAELAKELNLTEQVDQWQKIYEQLPGLAISENKELMVALDYPYTVSHRYLSNMMAIHPPGLIKWDDSDDAKNIIRSIIKLVDSIRPKYLVGYSYASLANLKARAKDGEGAVKALNIFYSEFCSANSFHLNGDQTKSGYSDFVYWPFTLERNFTFAAGLQEMLIQSHAGFLELFPAIPATWSNVSFKTMRAEGAFLVSAKKENGKVESLNSHSEKGESLKVKSPFGKFAQKFRGKVMVSQSEAGFILINFEPNSSVELNSI